MKVSNHIRCIHFPCSDVKQNCYLLPEIELRPENITIAMISEAAPKAKDDYYYAPGDPLFARTTALAFRDAGFNITTADEIIDLGVYLTTAVKCAKIDYKIRTATIDECSRILERELALFPNLEVLLLMGDTAIRALNYIARRNGEGRAIPAGSTYKIRGEKFSYKGMRVLPSYLQAGPSFFIEKKKRVMIAEDILAATRLAGIYA